MAVQESNFAYYPPMQVIKTFKYLIFKIKWFLKSISFLSLLLLELHTSMAQQRNIDSLNAILVKSKIDTNYVNCLNELCFEYKNAYKYEIADSIAKVALDKSQNLKFPHGILRSNLNLAEVQYEKANYSKSMEIYTQLIQLANNLGNKKYVAICYHRIAIINEDQGNLEESLKYNLLALDLRKEIGDKKGIGYSLGNIADYYISKSDFKTALNYLLKAMTIYNELRDQESIAYTTYNIGKVYFDLYNYTEALNFYAQSKDMTLAMNDLRAYATIVRSIAEVNVRLGRNEIAMKYFHEAIEVAKKINDEITLAQTYSGIGTVFQNQHKFTEAMENFSKASTLFEKLGFKVGILVTSINVGHANIELRNLNKAEICLNRAKALNRGMGFKEYDKEIYYHLFEIDSIKNNWKSAIQNYKMYTAYSDSLTKESNSKSIDSLRLNFDFTKKSIIEKSNYEKETALLTSKSKNERNLLATIFGGLILSSGLGFLNFRNRKKREQAVLAQMVNESDMKALRSQMNPHFIFNCIHTINRLLNELKIQESKTCLDQFSNLTRLVLENSKKREIPLSAELETLRLYMNLENMRFAKPFQYEFVIEPGIDPETTLVPPLILQPFVENSIKHGFRDPEKRGQLKIEIRTENESLVCSVADNGVGRNTVNIKTSSGFKKESLGIKLTEERLELISKTKKIKSHFLIDDLIDAFDKPAGTRVEIFLPYELSV